MEDVSVDGKVILKWMLMELRGRVGAVTEFVKQCLAVLTTEYHFEFHRRWYIPVAVCCCKRGRQLEVTKGNMYTDPNISEDFSFSR